jgi:hypothetical protein
MNRPAPLCAKCGRPNGTHPASHLVRQAARHGIYLNRPHLERLHVHCARAIRIRVHRQIAARLQG